ncbi:MAG: beta-lactamase family protein [Melioribacteraceae bacterium]|nr:beta-lactamase family protein [Melioribacteraceae bacterium]
MDYHSGSAGGIVGQYEPGIDKRYAAYASRIDSFFQNRYSRGLFNGSVLFAEKENIIYQNALGYGNFRLKDTLTLRSKFQLASVTKTLTAYGIALLKEKGLINYTDSIRHFFPQFPYENISIFELLVHRSGLPKYTYFADEYWRSVYYDSTITNNDVIELMIEHQPLKYYSPNFRYNYNNTNYCILAAVIEKVSEKSYEEFMKDEVFAPIGMINTEVYRRGNNEDKHFPVKGYTGYRRIADNTYLNGVVGDKGIYSTAEDLFKFNRALYDGKPLSRNEVNSMYLLAHEELYEHDNYGLGWRVNMRPDSTRIVYHTGWWKGFRSYFIRELSTEKCIIVLTNRSNSGVLSTRELMSLFDIKAEGVASEEETIDYELQ